MGNDDLWTQTDVGEKYDLEGMRMNHTAGNRRIFHRYSCLALCLFILLTLSQTEDSITIEFKISDTGIGIRGLREKQIVYAVCAGGELLPHKLYGHRAWDVHRKVDRWTD